MRCKVQIFSIIDWNIFSMISKRFVSRLLDEVVGPMAQLGLSADESIILQVMILCDAGEHSLSLCISHWSVISTSNITPVFVSLDIKIYPRPHSRMPRCLTTDSLYLVEFAWTRAGTALPRDQVRLMGNSDIDKRRKIKDQRPKIADFAALTMPNRAHSRCSPDLGEWCCLLRSSRLVDALSIVVAASVSVLSNFLTLCFNHYRLQSL